jgi:hypothetical protein
VVGGPEELRYLSLGGVAAQAIEGSGSGIEGRGSERGSQRRGTSTKSRRHCEGWGGRIECREGKEEVVDESL